VLQGGVLSPLLFNIYIDDLLGLLKASCYATLAYADDIALVIEHQDNLTKAIATITSWSNDNKISINYSKCGILLIQGNEINKEIGQIKLVATYKYLGVLLNTKLNPTNHINSINNKLTTYLKKNYQLLKSKFSIRELKTIYTYFQKSRLLYGMSAFLNHKSANDKLEQNCSKFIMSILKFNKCTRNKAKIISIIGEVQPFYTLLFRLINNLKKYKKHFGSSPNQWDDIIKKSLFELKVNNNSDTLKYDIYSSSLSLTLKNKYNIISSIELYDQIKNIWWKKKSKYDYTAVKLIAEVGWLSGDFKRACPLCQEEINGVKHIINTCTKTNEIRRIIRETLLRRNQAQEDLHQALVDSFFYQSKEESEQTKKRIFKVAKKLIELVVNEEDG